MYYLIAFLFSTVLVVSSCSGIWLFLMLAFIPVLLIGLLFYIAARNLGRRNDLPNSFFGRFWPLLLPWWLGGVVYIPLTFVYNFLPHNSFVLSSNFLSLGLVIIAFLSVFLIYSERNLPSRHRLKGVALICGLSLACYLIMSATYGWVRENVVLNANSYDRGETVVAHDGLQIEYRLRRTWHGVNVQEYTPFQEKEKLAVLPETPDLRITENWPRLDGSIALLPLYGAAAKAVYGGLDQETIKNYVVCNNTAGAFDRLLNGETDIYFGPPLSSAQKEMAGQRDLVLTQTPLALEAFVFLVHKDNPVESLSQDQIRGIYTKAITKWREVGGPDSRIMPFQRPSNSGSQAIMEAMVMKGEAMADPIAEEYQSGMGDLVRQVAAYRNRHNSLGYSFRWYATVLFSSPDIRLLALDGVEPTAANIRSRRYPVTAEVVAVTAGSLSEQTQTLLDWLTGPQGQELIGLTGYVPVERSSMHDSADI